MKVANTVELKNKTNELLRRVMKGEPVIITLRITKSGKPKALLVPLEDTRLLRRTGKGRGKWHVGPDFDAPLPEDTLQSFQE